MNSNDRVVKTAAGVDEVRTRSRKLPQRVRALLIMIDGSLTVDQLQKSAATLGVAADGLESLRTAGLVEIQPSAPVPPVAAARPSAEEADEAGLFRAAQRFMNESVVDALGLRAFMFTLKLDRCHSRADLIGLLDAFDKAILKASGAEVARVLGARARELLQRPGR